MMLDQPKGCEDGGIYYLSEQMIAEMKSLNPRDVARALLSDDGESDWYIKKSAANASGN